MSLPQKVQEELLRIITIVKKKDIDRIFHEPVDVVKFGLTNYHDVVKFPMDLGTVEVIFFIIPKYFYFVVRFSRKN